MKACRANMRVKGAENEENRICSESDPDCYDCEVLQQRASEGVEVSAEAEGAKLGAKHAKIMADAIVGALPPLRSETLLEVLIEAKEEIEHIMENDARNNDLYAGCPRQQRLIQKLQAEINKASK